MEYNKARIITNILNYGTKEATEWLKANYSRDDITEALLNPLPGEWNKKSYAYWSLVYGVSAPYKPKIITS